MEKGNKIYVAGHQGLVGSAIVRNLVDQGYTNLILKTHVELDLTRQLETESFFKTEKPEFVFLAAARVGGIKANMTFPAEFFYLNSIIQNNVIHSSYKSKVKKLLFLGSSCIYPTIYEESIREEALLSGYLESTNEAYAIAKISGLKMCQYYKNQYGCNFISCMPTNLYGPYDNFDLQSSHVLPALIRKIHDAKELDVSFVEVWGSGNPLRDFLYIDDMANACVFLMNKYNDLSHINIGTEEETSIFELAVLIKKIVGFKGELVFNRNMPDGAYRKHMNIDKLKDIGWVNKVKLDEGINKTYEWYKNKVKEDKK